ncbi:uncharacterized protein PAC_08116 [Phialocephala subalpina]|uniref:Uncharacterized protein n=1 Tax=Phialocephala subalpina TaxID=576137 RepID=A0A1L7WZM5_9HELO|nr:uncharacterized protein PAC_08116 [Phialocephala subalpina]
MASKRYSPDGYLLVDHKPFYPIRQSLYPLPPSPKDKIDSFLKTLDAFDFLHIQPEDLITLTKKFLRDNLVIPLGSCGIIDYSIECDILRPGSLNGENIREERAHVPELLKILKFINVNGIKGAESTRIAFPLGRLRASHHQRKRFTQSHWVIMVDQTRLIWALYADGIDKGDADKRKDGDLYAYNGAWDTAFGANRAGGEKVILLGSISDVPFKVEQSLDHIRVQGGIKWSTTGSDVDIRQPMIAPEIVSRLLGTNSTLVDIPEMRYIMRAGNMFELEHRRGYVKFCKDLQAFNESQGYVVGRTLMNAAWCKIVTWNFKISVNMLEGRNVDDSIRRRVKCFSDCILQVQDEEAQKYWDRLPEQHPGLDIATTQFDTSIDHNASLKQYLLSIYKDFKLHVCRKSADRIGKEMKSKDKVDIVENGPELKPIIEGELLLSAEQNAMKNVVEAEKQGLIKFIPKPEPKVEVKKNTKGKKGVRFAEDMDIDTEKPSKKVSSLDAPQSSGNSGKVENGAQVKKEANEDKMDMDNNESTPAPTPAFRMNFAKAARLTRLSEAPKPDLYASEPVYGPPTKPEVENGEMNKGAKVRQKVMAWVAEVDVKAEGVGEDGSTDDTEMSV